jgi:hypothetical protein
MYEAAAVVVHNKSTHVCLVRSCFLLFGGVMEVGMGHISVVTQIGIMNVYIIIIINLNRHMNSSCRFYILYSLLSPAYYYYGENYLRIVLAGTGPV